MFIFQIIGRSREAQTPLSVAINRTDELISILRSPDGFRRSSGAPPLTPALEARLRTLIRDAMTQESLRPNATSDTIFFAGAKSFFERVISAARDPQNINRLWDQYAQLVPLRDSDSIGRALVTIDSLFQYLRDEGNLRSHHLTGFNLTRESESACRRYIHQQLISRTFEALSNGGHLSPNELLSEATRAAFVFFDGYVTNPENHRRLLDLQIDYLSGVIHPLVIDQRTTLYRILSESPPPLNNHARFVSASSRLNHMVLAPPIAETVAIPSPVLNLVPRTTRPLESIYQGVEAYVHALMSSRSMDQATARQVASLVSLSLANDLHSQGLTDVDTLVPIFMEQATRYIANPNAPTRAQEDSTRLDIQWLQETVIAIGNQLSRSGLTEPQVSFLVDLTLEIAGNMSSRSMMDAEITRVFSAREDTIRNLELSPARFRTLLSAAITQYLDRPVITPPAQTNSDAVARAAGTIYLSSAIFQLSAINERSQWTAVLGSRSNLLYIYDFVYANTRYQIGSYDPIISYRDLAARLEAIARGNGAGTALRANQTILVGDAARTAAGNISFFLAGNSSERPLNPSSALSFSQDQLLSTETRIGWDRQLGVPPVLQPVYGPQVTTRSILQSQQWQQALSIPEAAVIPADLAAAQNRVVHIYSFVLPDGRRCEIGSHDAIYSITQLFQALRDTQTCLY